MPTYEVDYYNNCEAVRTKIITADNEKLIPSLLKKQDRRFRKVRKIKEIQPKEKSR